MFLYLYRNENGLYYDRSTPFRKNVLIDLNNNIAKICLCQLEKTTLKPIHFWPNEKLIKSLELEIK